MRGVKDLTVASRQALGFAASRSAAGDSRPPVKRYRKKLFCWLIRAGFVARGITYGVIGILALLLAVGYKPKGQTPNQQGALVLLARTPLGHGSLVIVAVGLLAYALWKFQHGFFARGPEVNSGGGFIDRVANLGGGAVYISFLVIDIQALLGQVGHSSSQPKEAAAGILGWPGGPVYVGIAGAVLIGISIYQAYDAIRGKFAEDCRTRDMGSRGWHTFMVLGHIGLVARAAVFAAVGYFVCRTAIEFNPSAAVGLDGALYRLRQGQLGPVVLGFVAAGLLVFAVFSFAEAHFREL
jgi:hypothetical protein